MLVSLGEPCGSFGSRGGITAPVAADGYSAQQEAVQRSNGQAGVHLSLNEYKLAPGASPVFTVAWCRLIRPNGRKPSDNESLKKLLCLHFYML